MPKISVITAAHNSANSIRRAIESIKGQTFQDWECIVCDDGSGDDTYNVVSNVVKDDSRFKLVRSRDNKGAGNARNVCIGLSTGEYLAIQDADDISMNMRLEKQIDFLEQNKHVAVVGTYARLYNKDGNYWGEWKRPLDPEKSDWVKDMSVTHGTAMMRKAAVIDVGCYDEKVTRVEDWDLLVRLVNKGYKIMTMPEFLYSVHWDITDYSRRATKYRWNEIKVRLKALRMRGVPRLYSLYLLRPIVTGLIPSRLMYLYHLRKFKKRSAKGSSNNWTAPAEL